MWCCFFSHQVTRVVDSLHWITTWTLLLTRYNKGQGGGVVVSSVNCVFLFIPVFSTNISFSNQFHLLVLAVV